MSQELESAPAEVLKFEYKHPNNGERHTVSVTREEVSHHMCDVLFEKLCDEFCECEPVGETDVVDCRCDEYADEFERVHLAAPVPPAGGEVECAICADLGDQCVTCEQAEFAAWADRHFASADYRQTSAGVFIQDWMRHSFAAWQARGKDVTRLQAENAALQQRLNVADQRVDELESKLVKVIREGYCVMPRRLTAENGAKALLLGEFKVTFTRECPECSELEEPTEGCDVCDGEGEFAMHQLISWDKIKFIYSSAVAGLALKPETETTTPQ